MLPLHAAGGSSTTRGSCLSDYAVSSYTPTVSALLKARDNLPTIPRKAVQSLLIAESDAPGLVHLSGVGHEVNAVAEVLYPHTKATVLLSAGKGVHKVEVISQLSKAPKILHLACHGEQNIQNPLASGFCLRDEKLTVAELMGLDLKGAFFAFLSACETAMGDTTQPDQTVHLGAAMLFVGFRSVVGTMW
jgi:CHAT domain-containing protein